MAVPVSALAALVLAIGASGAAAQDWQVDPSGGLNASTLGVGGALMYACAVNARPRRGAVVLIVGGGTLRGRFAGYVDAGARGGQIGTSWDCGSQVTGGSVCTAAESDVPRLRDALIRGDNAVALVGTDANPRAVVVVSLSGSARAIANIRGRCRGRS